MFGSADNDTNYLLMFNTELISLAKSEVSKRTEQWTWDHCVSSFEIAKVIEPSTKYKFEKDRIATILILLL